MKKVTVTLTKPSDKSFLVDTTLTASQLNSLFELRTIKQYYPTIVSYSFTNDGNTMEYIYIVNTEEDYNSFLSYVQNNVSFITDETNYNTSNNITRTTSVEDVA